MNTVKIYYVQLSRLSKKATFFLNWFRYCNINTTATYKIRFSLIHCGFKIMNKFIDVQNNLVCSDFYFLSYRRVIRFFLVKKKKY